MILTDNGRERKNTAIFLLFPPKFFTMCRILIKEIGLLIEKLSRSKYYNIAL